MKRHTMFIAAVLVTGLIAVGARAQSGSSPDPGAAMHTYGDSGTMDGMTGSMGCCGNAMMGNRQQAMHGMRAADARLDSLVTRMNAARGDARLAAMAGVLDELVARQKGGCPYMTSAEPGAMNPMMKHMMSGMAPDAQKSMSHCPMMGGSGGAKDGSAETQGSGHANHHPGASQ